MFTDRMAFGVWLNDMRTEPLPFSEWPPAVLDDITVDSLVRMLDLNAAFGYNKLDIFGLFTTWGWPVEIRSAVDRERAKRVRRILKAAKQRDIDVVYGLGIYSWGFDEIIRHDPEVRGPNEHAMCASSEASWEWQKKVTDFVLEWGVDGLHLESADLGRCSCDKCMERWPDEFEYHHHLTSITADYVRQVSPETSLCPTLISWMDWNQKLNEKQKNLLVDLSTRVDCIYDQGHHSCYLEESERAAFIGRLESLWGTSGGLWVYPPFRYTRQAWFLPYTQRTGDHIRSLYADGGRGVMYYQGPPNNPGVEVNIAFGGRIMLHPEESVDDALAQVLEDLYEPRTPKALAQLVDVFQGAEEAYFGNLDFDDERKYLKGVKTFPGPGELYVSFPGPGASGPPAYLLEPYLTAEGRAAYTEGIEASLRKALDIQDDLKNQKRMRCLLHTMINAVTSVKTTALKDA